MTTGLALAAGIAVTALVPTVSASAEPATPAAACGSSPSDKHTGEYAKQFNGDFVNLRSGPSTNCEALGQGQSSHTVDFHCSTGTSTSDWTYLRDVTTGTKGWVRNDQLKWVPTIGC